MGKAPPVPFHPLDALSAAEVVQVAAVCHARYAQDAAAGHTLRFNAITLQVSFCAARVQRYPAALLVFNTLQGLTLCCMPAQACG